MNFVLREAQLSSCSFAIGSLRGTDLMLIRKNAKFKIFRKSDANFSDSILSTLTRAQSSTRFPVVTRLTVHRRCQFHGAGGLVGSENLDGSFADLRSV